MSFKYYLSSNHLGLCILNKRRISINSHVEFREMCFDVTVLLLYLAERREAFQPYDKNGDGSNTTFEANGNGRVMVQMIGKESRKHCMELTFKTSSLPKR